MGRAALIATPRWLARSVRNKLLAIALLPLFAVLPLLLAGVALWGDAAYDRVLISKVRSDLAVARGYFEQVVVQVGGGTEAIAASHALLRALQRADPPALERLLATERDKLALDFLVIETLPTPTAAAQVSYPDRSRSGRVAIVEGEEFARLAPHLGARLRIPLVPTRNAAPSTSSVENRALVVLASAPVHDDRGAVVAILRGGTLLNQNLPFIDHINRIVYPEGALPFGSQGTATLFLDDVRITTNVRLFQDERAIGTRVSQAVSDAVLKQGKTWLDRAFVVNDWYVSAYEPLLDAAGERIGMLYVGFLERPFRLIKYALLAATGAIVLGVMALAALFSVRLARTIFSPVERMNRTMRLAQQGQGRPRVGPVAAQDELGSLARHLDHLLDAVDEKTQHLRHAAEVLDLKVAERTQQLADSNASLQQAQLQLVKSEKLAAIGQLTASIAHEINNPIAVMQGNLDLMRETLGASAQPVAAELALLERQVERMRLIVTQLLQYARPTEYAGYVQALDVNGVIDECLVLAAHELGKTRIEVAKDYGATHPAGFNHQELQQVMLNLLLNAIQAMPAGGQLVLRTRDWSRGDGAPGVCIEVQDSGPGLAPEVLAQLFRPFFTTRREGNGLGLWISQGLVERYGGSIEADPAGAPGGGALLRVCLLCEPEAPAAPPPDPGPPAAAPA